MRILVSKVKVHKITSLAHMNCVHTTELPPFLCCQYLSLNHGYIYFAFAIQEMFSMSTSGLCTTIFILFTTSGSHAKFLNICNKLCIKKSDKSAVFQQTEDNFYLCYFGHILYTEELIIFLTMCFTVFWQLWIFMSDHSRKSIIMSYNEHEKCYNKKIWGTKKVC